MNVPLSVAIIASNEEDNIGRCLQSVLPISSEIIVVVNDSTDNTCEIARSFGAKVYFHPWEGFSVQKNFALSMSSQKWILCLDADEELDDVLCHSIKNFIQDSNHKYSGAYFSRRTFFMNRWIKYGDWSPDYITRVVRKGYGQWSNNNVHEKLIISGKVKKLPGYLRHYSYRSISQYIYKNLRYAELYATEGENTIKHIKAVSHALWKFFRGYVIKLGFLDGYAGLYIALMQSFFTLYKYSVNMNCKRDFN